ncbi:inorganic pyrophosphatase 2, mitochondrial [Clarias gariepinus]|uniref:inorganic pyrophosphatase 2, mitochondrial n=1 Tax=Clarias gariepinus TaxID=13013 RepID=UPI00234C1DC8|nr:inorganic pyrophosphatase 2, mitochondrial [Clarias gariepinus]
MQKEEMDPGHTDSDKKSPEDNDSIHMCDIGNKVCSHGEIIRVKELGIPAVIDEGETNRKVIVINVEAPDAGDFNVIEDVMRLRPAYLEATVDWFKKYKVPNGKPESQFTFSGEFKNRDFAIKTMKDLHEYWKALILSKNKANDLNWCDSEQVYHSLVIHT